jgi:hypothetical protein
VETEFAKSVIGYSTVFVESSTVNVQGGKVNYSLFPVWVLNTKYQNENYMFLMNGQSGLLVGRLPIDKGKAWKYRLIFMSVIGMALTFLSSSFDPTHIAIAWLIALLIGSAIVNSWKKGMNTVALKTQAAAYIVPGSFKFRTVKERFLYCKTTMTKRSSK